MSIFGSTEKMYEVLGEVWESVMNDSELGPKLKSENMTIKFNINDPDGQIWLKPSGEVICGSDNDDPTIEMFLSGDSCHKFWMKELKLPTAIATGKIKTKGPVNKVLKLLPMLKPVYERYPEIAEKHGLKVH